MYNINNNIKKEALCIREIIYSSLFFDIQDFHENNLMHNNSAWINIHKQISFVLQSSIIRGPIEYMWPIIQNVTREGIILKETSQVKLQK